MGAGPGAAGPRYLREAAAVCRGGRPARTVRGSRRCSLSSPPLPKLGSRARAARPISAPPRRPARDVKRRHGNGQGAGTSPAPFPGRRPRRRGRAAVPPPPSFSSPAHLPISAALLCLTPLM